MSIVIEDYLKPCGNWAKAKKLSGKTCQTLSGTRWFSMNRRCNDENYQQTHPNYSDVVVGFSNFNTFVEWSREQTGYSHKDWQLDKDVLVRGNKVYSEYTCVFLPRELNSMIVWKNKSTTLPPGVHPHHNKFIASCKFGGKSTYLGIKETAEGAFLLYKTAKEDFIKQQAEKWRDKIDPRAYNALMQYEVEITD